MVREENYIMAAKVTAHDAISAPLSLIRTMTVGFGVAPNLLSLIRRKAGM